MNLQKAKRKIFVTKRITLNFTLSEYFYDSYLFQKDTLKDSTLYLETLFTSVLDLQLELVLPQGAFIEKNPKPKAFQDENETQKLECA